MTLWRENPPRFVTDTWPGVKLESFQREGLQALADHGRVSIRSAHGVGKSAMDAWAVLWFISCFYPCKILCSAPSFPQLEDVLWAELAYWYRQMPAPMQRQFELKKDHFEMVEHRKESFASARTASRHTPEALQGFHSPKGHVLLVLDEASGIPDKVFEVGSGTLTKPNARVLMTSNPTRTSGYFYDSHHANRSRWHCIKVADKDSSQVDDSYGEEIAANFGQDSNIYRVRVLGEFPATDDDTIMPLDLVESAVDRVVNPIDTEPLIWGVDVARFGDDRTVLIARKGNIVPDKHLAWRNIDTMQTAGRIKDKYDSAFEKPKLITVDVIGIGAGVVDRLKEMKLPVRGVNVAESPAIGARYNRLRDELWYKGKEWFMGRDVRIKNDTTLIGELTTPKYTYTSAGKVRVESKDDMKRRGIPSPDVADAFLLTFASGGRARNRAIEYTKKMTRWIV